MFYSTLIGSSLFTILLLAQRYSHPLAQGLPGPMRLSRGLPRAECWGRLDSVFYCVSISGLFGQCTYIDLWVNCLTRTAGGPPGGCGLLPTAQVFFLFLCALQFPRTSNSSRGCCWEATVLCIRVWNHAAAYECKEIGISHAPIFTAIYLPQRGSGEL